MKKLFRPIVALLTIGIFAVACDNSQVTTDPTTDTAQLAPALKPAPYEAKDGSETGSLTLAVAPSMGDCGAVINDTGSAWELTGDCTTTTGIAAPVAFYGNGYMVTATGAFKGAVVRNAGTTLDVADLTIRGDGITGCMGGDDRLRGVMLEGASGSVMGVTVENIHRGPNGCQEGNGIEVRNAPFDGTHPNTQFVTLSHINIEDYQKTGIVANGDVNVSASHVNVGRSAAEEVLAPNGIQYGFGATGSLWQWVVEGVQWKGTSNFASAALLVYQADNMDVSHGRIGGNSDIGVYAFGDNGTYAHNDVRDEGADHPNSGYDIGVGNWGTGNSFSFTKVCGFDTNYDPDPMPGKQNKELPDKACK